MKLVVLFLLFSLLLKSDVCEQIRCPIPEEIETFGCRVLTVEEGQWKGWNHVRVWTRSREGREWTFLLSVRPPRETKKALKDCGEFMDSVQKRLSEEKSR